MAIAHFTSSSTTKTNDELPPQSKKKHSKVSRVMAVLISGILLCWRQHATTSMLRSLYSGAALRERENATTTVLASTTRTRPTSSEKINKTQELVIFYNIFINPQNARNGIRIVQEQLEARAAQRHLANATLHYTRIGDLNASLPPCDPCIQLGAVETGDEEFTLQSLYEYCQSNTASRVIYIHNKGSFTKTASNERLRRVLTKAAFSSQCSEMPRQQEDQCNMCSAHFSVYPAHHTVGNMFVAECDYVQKLIPPNRFAEAKETAITKARSLTWEQLGFPAKPRRSRLYQFERDSWVGVKRYAMEHWVYSHPSVRPCDVYHFEFKYSRFRPPANWDTLLPDRQLAPLGDENLRMSKKFHPWFLLPGRLYEYRELYSQVPPNTSWVYSQYPNTSVLDAF